MKQKPQNPFMDALSSLQLTVICLVAAFLLVLVGTLAQVHQGIHEVQERYFQSLIVYWSPSDFWPDSTGGSKNIWIPVFPGGHLIGAVLLVNLITAHIRRFRWSTRQIGIQLTHLGLIIMLGGGLFTDWFAVESFMRLSTGETRNYSEDSRWMEVAVIDESDAELDQVTAIPQQLLKTGKSIDHPSLPFVLKVRRFYLNSKLSMASGSKGGADQTNAVTQGVGTRVQVEEQSQVAAENRRDIPAAIIEIVMKADGKSLGSWLVSDVLGAPQRFFADGKSWRILMRQRRYYHPYSLTLKKFTHEKYAGTEIAKNFASKVLLDDPSGSEKREVLIYMNHPLRYRGETYYQAGFENNDQVTVLQVVHNPGFVAPYVACCVVGLGLLIQFGIHFTGFLRRMVKTGEQSARPKAV